LREGAQTALRLVAAASVGKGLPRLPEAAGRGPRIGRAPAARQSGRNAMKSSNITPGHVRAFQAVTTQLYGEVGLWSCCINGEPGVAIVLAEHVGEGKVGIMPLFVAITPGMEVEFDGEQSGGDDEGGPRREFRENAEVTRPALRPS
jgi:hypothetical protein